MTREDATSNEWLQMSTSDDKCKIMMLLVSLLIIEINIVKGMKASCVVEQK